MTKITKIGIDGKEHVYWKVTEEEAAANKKSMEEMENKMSNK